MIKSFINGATDEQNMDEEERGKNVSMDDNKRMFKKG